MPFGPFFGRWRAKKLGEGPPQTAPKGKHATQRIELTYSDYSKIFKTIPENRPDEKDLSEDFFETLEKVHLRPGREIELRIVFPTETKDEKVEKEVRTFYRENYEDDIAMQRCEVARYRNESKRFVWLTSGLIITLGVLDLLQHKGTEIFQSIAEKVSNSPVIRDIAFVADRVLYHADYMVMLVWLFTAAHLLLDKPRETFEKIKETERLLRAKIYIITKEDLERRKKTDKPSDPQPASAESPVPSA
jgi:hypothetical protein